MSAFLQFLWFENEDRRGIEVHWTIAWKIYKETGTLIHGRKPIPDPAICLEADGR
jgi:hypothetical protein